MINTSNANRMIATSKKLYIVMLSKHHELHCLLVHIISEQ